MNSHEVLALWILLGSISCFGAQNEIQAMLDRILGSATDADLPTIQQLLPQVNERTLASLKPAKVRDILPPIEKCLRSHRLEVKREGLLFVTAIQSRLKSTDLLAPLVEDLERIADDAKAISYLQAHLNDRSNSSDQQRSIAVSLVQASPDHPGLPRDVLLFTRQTEDPNVKIGVLAQVSISRFTDEQTLDFLAASLREKNALVREAAIACTRKLGPDMRIRFEGQLRAISQDSQESQRNRNAARDLITK